MDEKEYKQHIKDSISKYINEAQAEDIVLDAEGITEPISAAGDYKQYRFMGRKITLKIYIKAEESK
jgi:UDP-N-acetylmuramyl tripeptide synthase